MATRKGSPEFLHAMKVAKEYPTRTSFTVGPNVMSRQGERCIQMPIQRESRPARGGEAASIPTTNRDVGATVPLGVACLRCGRRLTAATSRARGIGDICWAHLRAPAEAAALAGGLGLLGDLAQRLSDSDDPDGAIGAAACSEVAVDFQLLPMSETEREVALR